MMASVTITTVQCDPCYDTLLLHQCLHLFVMFILARYSEQFARLSCRSRCSGLIDNDACHDLADYWLHTLQSVKGIWCLFEDRKNRDADHRRRRCLSRKESANVRTFR